MRVEIIQFLIFCWILHTSLACDGYKIVLRKISNCGDDNQIIKISSNSTMSINDNCEAFSSICADVRPYKSAISKVVIWDSGLVLLNITKDICAKNKNVNDLVPVLKAGSGLRCNGGNENFFCDNNRKVIKLSGLAKKFLGIVSNGNLTIRNVIKHDSGSTCIEAGVTVRHKKK